MRIQNIVTAKTYSRVIMLGAVFFLTSCASMTANQNITGVATYRERIALPPDAVFEATLEDVSRADAPSQVIAHTQVKTPLTPIAFTLKVDSKKFIDNHRYVVRGKILQGEQLLFTTDTAYPVTAQQPAPLNLLLRMVLRSASLENTRWTLVMLNGQAINAGAATPNLLLQSADQRVSGFGGCNQFMGGYVLAGQSLTFKQMASSMKACLSGMESEAAMLIMLGKVTNWRVTGRQLELLDANNSVLAQFAMSEPG